jgi:hypothetical protein
MSPGGLREVVKEELPLAEKAAYVGSTYAVGAVFAFVGWLLMKRLMPEEPTSLGQLTLIGGGLAGLLGLGLAITKGVLY